VKNRKRKKKKKEKEKRGHRRSYRKGNEEEKIN
jgi:hypothetical protein